MRVLSTIIIAVLLSGCASIEYGEFSAKSFLKDIAVDEVIHGDTTVKGYTSNAKSEAALNIIEAVKP